DSSVMGALLLPELADGVQLAFHGARHTSQLGGDFLAGIAFHFPQGYRTQLALPQAIQQALALLGHLGRELGRRLSTDDLLQLHVRRRSLNCWKRPASAPRQKLLKALKATSSSSAPASRLPWSFLRAKATKGRKKRSQSWWAAASSPAWSGPIQRLT